MPAPYETLSDEEKVAEIRTRFEAAGYVLLAKEVEGVGWVTSFVHGTSARANAAAGSASIARGASGATLVER